MAIGGGPQLYRWRWPVRVVLVLAAAVAGVLASPLLFLALAILVYPIGLLLGMAGLDAGAPLIAAYASLVAAAFGPAALPTWLPRLVTAIVVAAGVTLLVGTVLAWRRAPLRRRSRGMLAWALIGAPFDAAGAIRHFTQALWDLLKGGSALKVPAPGELSRRFAELLDENLGQPGFREVILVVHDLDARRDLVFGLVREPFRRALFPATDKCGRSPRGSVRSRRSRQRHLVDVMSAALSVAGFTDPVLMSFASDSYWRGEVHRLIDRPGEPGPPARRSRSRRRRATHHRFGIAGVTGAARTRQASRRSDWTLKRTCGRE